MDSKKFNKIEKKTVEKDRRSFLKKAVYSAPSLLVLGSLSRPTQSMAASGGWDTSPGDQSTWSTGGQG